METWFALLSSGLVLAALQTSPSSGEGNSAKAIFTKPKPLTAGKFVLGAKLRYPSPRLYDLDGDGSRELIVGDLTGKLHVSSRLQSSSRRHWKELTPLTTDGTELKFNNW